MTSASAPTIASTLCPARSGARLACSAALFVTGSIALMISTRIRGPFYPLPMMVQTLAALALGAGFGARLVAAAVALHLSLP